MESRNRYQGVHPHAVGTVRFHARKLARSPGFHPDDVEDLEQELMLHIHRQMVRHNPDRASTGTFLSRMVDNFAISLHRQATANGVGEVKFVSLSEPVQDEDGNTSERLDLLPSDLSPWPNHGTSWHEEVENRVEVSRLLKRLPPSLRQLALLFMTEPVSTVSRTRGISRQSLYEVVARMRRLVAGPAKKIPTTLRPAAYVTGMRQA